jgi:hypothetical protein
VAGSLVLTMAPAMELSSCVSDCGVMHEKIIPLYYNNFTATKYGNGVLPLRQ